MATRIGETSLRSGKPSLPTDGRRFWSGAALALFMLAFAACGGGGVDESLLEGLEFDFSGIETDDPAAAASAGADEVLSAFAGIGLVDLEQGFKVAYLHDMYSMVDDVKASSRNIQKLGEAGSDEEAADLDWVIEVHDAHAGSEELRHRVYSYPFTDDLGLNYVDFHADFLRGVEIYTLCADRLLEGALMLGHDLSAGDLAPAAWAEFRSLVGESTFYCDQAETFNTQSLEELRRHINALRFGP